MVRFGVIIVGVTMTGKSVIRDVLSETLTLLRKEDSENLQHQAVESRIINPKSITMDELYGSFSILSQEWTVDGLASSIIRKFVSTENSNYKWVIFDGPVDALWIENMNTVLDDNMTLCLSNGERVRLKSDMKMIFEVDHLAGASPATISRCGMIYMDNKCLDWKSIVLSWLNTLKDPEVYNDKIKEHITALAYNYVEKALAYIRKYCSEPIRTSDVNLVRNLCTLFEGVFTKQNGVNLKGNPEDVKKYVSRVFLFSLSWGLAGSLDPTSVLKFENFLTAEYNPSELPRGSIFDYFISTLQTSDKFGEYSQWVSIMPTFEYKRDYSFFKLVVPTKDTTRYSWLLKTRLSKEIPVFLTGMTGVGKSIIASSSINDFKSNNNFESIFITFSSQTSSHETQFSIESKLEKRRKNLLGGPNNKKVAIFIDDVNMPAYDEYGSQPPIELLRQYVDYKGVYDREKLFWKNIEDATLVCAAAPPGGGRKVITPRFIRHFHLLNIPPTSEGSITTIFKTILDGFLQTFKQDVQKLSDSIISATIHIYERISAELLPMPAKSHYTFNLRDISKVFQGILMSNESTSNEPEQLIKLWIHECSRVFHDRLVNSEDRQWFKANIIKLLSSSFRVDWAAEDIFDKNILIWGDFLQKDSPLDERVYEEIKDIGKMTKTITEYVEDYNMEYAGQMDLVLFRDALEHIARIVRILRQPRGNAMLIGVGGCGKQTLTRLSAFISGCDFMTVEVKKNFNQANFRENIKNAMLPAGINGKPIVFLINDTQITNEAFLEDINNLLNSGEVPNLMAAEDMDKILTEIMPIAQQNGVQEGFYNYFVQRLRENLHIVLCMSPVGESLRFRIRMFPSLVNCCTIDWISTWPEEALLSVSSKFIKSMVEIQNDEIKDRLAELCVYIHTSVEQESEYFYESLKRKVYVTPKSYLDLIKAYQAMLVEKDQELKERRNILFAGLSKLEDTNITVAELQAELIKIAPILEQSVIEQENLSKVLDVDRIEANKKKAVVEEETREIDKRAAEVAKLQFEAQDAIDKAVPILVAANNALSSLNKSDITELKMVSQPTTMVLTTFQAVSILLEEKTDWPSIKKYLGPDFFERLKTFKKDSIPPKVIKKLDTHLSEHPEWIPSEAAKGSQAAKSLCEWVLAVHNYHNVEKKMEPKRKHLEAMNKELKEANDFLNEKKDQLRKELEKVESLEKKFNEAKASKEKLDKEIILTKVRLQRAEKLTVGLADEHIRWKENVATLDDKILKLVGDVFLAAASISYNGPFTGPFREKLIKKWKDKCDELSIPVSEKFTLQTTLGKAVEIQEWNIQGLPSDSVSIDNGIMVMRCLRRPLMIDPQMQAKNWIKKNGEQRDLKIIRANAPTLLKTLENAIKMGQELLIEEVSESLDPALEPILTNRVFKNNMGRLMITMGDATFEYDKNFKLYLTTKIPNPQFLPDIFIRVTVINFTVTEIGLDEQLLAEIVKKENPGLETKKAQLILAISQDQKRLKGLEDNILKSLADSSGNILDDEMLIQYLDESKKMSNVIKERMIQNEQAQTEIEEARSKYKPVSKRGSIMYFVIRDISGIDPMYQYSLVYFTKLFNNIIETSRKSENINERITILLESVTESVFLNICRGLFNVHKLIFSFLIASQILKNRDEISDKEWNLLLKGLGLDAKPKDIANPDPTVYSEKTWKLICSLEDIHPGFGDVAGSVKGNTKEWVEYTLDKQIQDKEIPNQLSSKLTDFQKLLLIKVLREEKLTSAIRTFIKSTLGNKFANPLPPTMEEVFDDSDCKTPIVFILTQGADPTGLLQRFVSKRLGTSDSDAIKIISLGQGQGPAASRLLEVCSAKGEWVLLQNCHLCKSWMPTLENIVLQMQETGGVLTNPTVHENFRLFLTSMPCDYFPVTVLQNGIKFTCEPPKGLKANIIGSLKSNLPSEEKAQTSASPAVYKKLIYGICFFHAIVQERRKFGSLGWNISYQFNESDLETALKNLNNLLNVEPGHIPWGALRFVTGEIIYGGRVTDEFDRRCLMSMLDLFLHEDMLNEGHSFTETRKYMVPVSEITLESYVNHAEKMPDIDEPELFGLNENANIAYQMKESVTLIETILSIQPRQAAKSSDEEMTPDQIASEIASRIEADLPQELSKKEAHSDMLVTDKSGLLDSLTIFLFQEIERYNILITVMKKTLEDLRNAIKGMIVMSEDLDKMYKSMLDNKVPEMWAVAAYSSVKPLASWVEDLKERINFLRNWLVEGKTPAYWVSAFFFPQGFLTAVLQNYARRYKIEIDILSFTYEIMHFYSVEDIDGIHDHGVLVYGLFSEGGYINPSTLVLEEEKPGEKISPVPMILFIPSESPEPDEADYKCPVFKTSERVMSSTGHTGNYIISIDVPTDKRPAHWIRRGVAFICQKDD